MDNSAVIAERDRGVRGLNVNGKNTIKKLKVCGWELKRLFRGQIHTVH